MEMLYTCGLGRLILMTQILVDCPTNGAWTASSETNRFTYNAG
jgi:hypothetical protein